MSVNRLKNIIKEEYDKINRENIYDILDNFKFTDENIGYHNNQSDNIISMYDKSNILLARINYVIYKDEITISYIESYVKGKGYGKIAMIYLARKYGYENLLRSSLTPEGAKMRNELDNLFNFDYKEYLESLNKHLSPDTYKLPKDNIIKAFIRDLSLYGLEKGWGMWINKLKESGLMNRYDFNDISEIAEWIKGSVANNNDPMDEPPHWVIDTLNLISK